jgi:hypothetical protein
MIHQLIHKFSYIAGIAICLTFILWSYFEDGFYDNYISGNPFLIWTVYVFPWVVVILTLWHYFKTKQS